jgi:YidC/Oxa1 family membrane protein insertase
VYTDAKKYQKVEFADIEKGKASFEKNSTQGYVAMVQHYFASAWVLPADTVRENFASKVDNNLYAVGMITPSMKWLRVNPKPLSPPCLWVLKKRKC